MIGNSLNEFAYLQSIEIELPIFEIFDHPWVSYFRRKSIYYIICASVYLIETSGANHWEWGPGEVLRSIQRNFGNGRTRFLGTYSLKILSICKLICCTLNSLCMLFLWYGRLTLKVWQISWFNSSQGVGYDVTFGNLDDCIGQH